MTTATPERTVTPLYDQALEDMLAGDASCAWCPRPPIALWTVPCGHESATCVRHDAMYEMKADNLRNGMCDRLLCVRCGAATTRQTLPLVNRRPI